MQPDTNAVNPTKAPAKPPTKVDLSNAALMRPARSPADIRNLFECTSIQSRISAVLPKHLTPERMAKVAISAITKTPELLQCSQLSLLQSIIHLSELGLEPSGALGLAYLVPYAGACTAIIGWRGYIELARRSGMVAGVRARIVYKGDRVEFETGMEESFKVFPDLDAPDGRAIRLVFSVADFTPAYGSGKHFEYMTYGQIERVRQRSASSKSKKSPWNTDYDEMARKTVIRRAAKYWPLSPELRRAMEVDADQDTVDGEFTKVQVPGAEFEIPALMTGEQTMGIDVSEQPEAEALPMESAEVAAQAVAEAQTPVTLDSSADPDAYADDVERQLRAATTIAQLAEAGKKVRGLPPELETRLLAVFQECKDIIKKVSKEKL